MRRPLLATLLLTGVLFTGACTDDRSPSLPTQPPRLDLVNPTSSEIETEITALFPTTSKLGNLQASALNQLAPIETDIATNTAASIKDAQRRAILLVGFTINDYRLGLLIGGKSSTTAQLTVRFIISLLRFVLLPVPPIDPSVLSGDGTIQVCLKSSTSSCQVVVPSHNAGVRIPPGALPADVLVAVLRLDDAFTPPDPQGRTQYPLVFQIMTTPAVTLPEDSPAVVAVCQYNEGDMAPPRSVRGRLQIGHFLADGTVELLPRADGSFIGLCSSETSPTNIGGLGFGASKPGAVGWRALRYVGAKLADLLSPAPLYATHTALAGTTRSFSPFKAVDPGAPAVSSVSVSPNPAEVSARSTLQLTATPRAADESDLTGQVSCTWAVTNPPEVTVATVNQSGLLTGVTPGEASVTATCGGVGGTVKVIVDSPPA